MAFTPAAFKGVKLNAFYNTKESLNNTSKMPVLFLGFDSRMNAIEENEFHRDLEKFELKLKYRKLYYVFQHIRKQEEPVLQPHKIQKPFMILVNFHLDFMKCNTLLPDIRN